MNPWKVRQEEQNRKRWKESQEQPLVPLQQERVVPKPPVNANVPAKTSTKANGVGKSEGMCPLRVMLTGVGKGTRKHRNELPAPPPALEDPEAWPSPDVAANVEKEETKAVKPVLKENPPKEAREIESAVPKEPRDGKKKKWEKLEVNFQYDPPQSRRGRGGKYYRNSTKPGSREANWKGRDERTEKEDKPRKHEGEERHPSPREGVDRRAQSLSFEAGHRQSTSPSAQWPVRGRASHDALRSTAENWRRTSSQSRSSGRNVSGQRSQSPGSPRDKSAARPIENNERRPSQSTSPNGLPAGDSQSEAVAQQTHIADMNEDQTQNQQLNSGRRPFRGMNTFSPTSFPQPYMTSPQQMPMFGPYFPPPVQTFPRSHSVPFATNSPSRYPQYPQPYYPDFSRLGMQPVTVDEDLKQRIVRQVYHLFQDLTKSPREYYFSSENLYKDMFLRKKMDSQGFVPIQSLVQFQRLKEISNDVPTVLNALLNSPELEVLFNSDRGPLVRARHDPMKWVYPPHEREESAQNPGPADHYYRAHQDTLRQMQEFQQVQFQQQFGFQGAPPFMFEAGAAAAFTGGAYPAAASFRSREPSEMSSPPGPVDMDVARSPVSPHYLPENRKLSSEASPFVPNGVPFHPMMNGDAGAYDMHAINNALPETDGLVQNVSEEDLATIAITVADPKEKPIVPAMPVNGVNHNKQPSQEFGSPPISWRFTNNERDSRETKKGFTQYSYPDFRSRVLESRQNQKSKKESPQMLQLYTFWSRFLLDRWSPSVYSDFLRCAVEDANENRRHGLFKLFEMYEAVLEFRFQPSFWTDFVRLAGEDYRNGHLAGIEIICRIRSIMASKGQNVTIQDGDVSRLVEAEIHDPSDFDRLRREVKPAGFVLVPYTTVWLPPK